MDIDKKIGIVVGSRSDFRLFVPALETLKSMHLRYEFTIASAHRTPERLHEWIRKIEEAGIEVIIAGAGAAAHLPGVVASQTLLPVIGIPIDSTHLRGIDALYSIVQMPPGIPVATVGINNVDNAVMLALHILAIKYPLYRKLIEHYRSEMPQKIEDHMKELREEYPELLGEAGGQADSTPDEKSKKVTTAFETADKKIFETLERDFRKFSETIQEKRQQEVSVEETPRQRKKKAAPESSYACPPEMTKKASPAIKATGKARIVAINPAEPEAELIEEASIILLEGGIVAFPTDSVYGIGVDATNVGAVNRLYKIKERDVGKAIPILIHSICQLGSLVTYIPAEIEPVLERFWPGPLTVIFEKYKKTFTAVSRDATIGIRIPDNLVCVSLLSMMARPMATTSANLSGQPPATSAQSVARYFGDAVDLILDSGIETPGFVSTVLSTVSKPFEILREGKISRDELISVLGQNLIK